MWLSPQTALYKAAGARFRGQRLEIDELSNIPNKLPIDIKYWIVFFDFSLISKIRWWFCIQFWLPTSDFYSEFVYNFAFFRLPIRIGFVTSEALRRFFIRTITHLCVLQMRKIVWLWNCFWWSEIGSRPYRFCINIAFVRDLIFFFKYFVSIWLFFNLLVYNYMKYDLVYNLIIVKI